MCVCVCVCVCVYVWCGRLREREEKGEGRVSQSLAWAPELATCFIFMEDGLPLISTLEMH